MTTKERKGYTTVYGAIMGQFAEDICEKCGKRPKVKVKPNVRYKNIRYCKECRSEIAKANASKKYREKEAKG